MAIEIRNVRADELTAYVKTTSVAFLEHLATDGIQEELEALWDLSRTWAAIDGATIAGTFRSWATEITVPGGAKLAGAAVAGVTVRPTHRRQGLLRRLAAAEHAGIRDRGEVVGLLYASEYPIYGRFGYGSACRQAEWTLRTGIGFHGEVAGSVEIVEPSEVVRDELIAVFEAWRARQSGEIRRRPFRWDNELGLRPNLWEPRWQGWVALHRDPAGAVDGYVRYRADQKWAAGESRTVIIVDELHALTDDAYDGLWRFLAEIDLAVTVRAERRRPAERLPWLLMNARAAQASTIIDGLWVRLFDVRRALEARTYERSGAVTLEIVDPEAAGGRVRLLLDATPDGATCRPTDRSPDLTVGVAALGAAYLGGTRLRDAAIAAGLDEHSPGAAEAAEALLRTTDEPWCSTFF